MLAPRWDAASYLLNSTGAGNPAKKGAATFSYNTSLVLGAKPGAEERFEQGVVGLLQPERVEPHEHIQVLLTNKPCPMVPPSPLIADWSSLQSQAHPW